MLGDFKRKNEEEKDPFSCIIKTQKECRVEMIEGLVCFFISKN